MRRLLVTGGAGFIGANFVRYWMERHPGDRVVALDALTYAGNLTSLDAVKDEPKFRFVHADIRDGDTVDQLMAEEGIDTIVHFAAESHVDRSIAGPDVFIQTNVVGTHVLLRAAKRAWLDNKSWNRPHRFHHISTDEVYGSLDPGAPAFSEQTPYAPNSPYAASKAASDHLVRAYHHTYGLQVTTSNCSNNYGPHQSPEKLIPLMIVNLLEGRLLPVYGDGHNIRDWLFVKDHCRGIELILERGAVGEFYNIGGNNERSNIDVVQQLCALVDDTFANAPELKDRFPDTPAANDHASKSLVTFVDDRPGHDRRYAIDATKITGQLRYAPQESYESGLRKTLHWYLNNESWWRAMMDGGYQDWVR